MDLHNIFTNNSNYTNNILISQAVTYYCNSKLTENIQFEKCFHLYFVQHFRKSARKLKFKCRILEGLRVSFNMDIYTQINFHLMGWVIDTREFERKKICGQPLSSTHCFQFSLRKTWSILAWLSVILISISFVMSYDYHNHSNIVLVFL